MMATEVCLTNALNQALTQKTHSRAPSWVHACAPRQERGGGGTLGTHLGTAAGDSPKVAVGTCRTGAGGCPASVLMECQLPPCHSRSSNLQVTQGSGQKLPTHFHFVSETSKAIGNSSFGIIGSEIPEW